MDKKETSVPTAEAEAEATSATDRRHYLDDVLQRARRAASIYESYTQERVDRIVEEVALATAGARIPLAELAVEETGMGLVVDKVIKNHFATEYVYNQIRGIRTCGVIAEDKVNRIKTIAQPVGVVIAVIPVTNPTSTAVFKAIVNLKARNAVVFAPPSSVHPEHHRGRPHRNESRSGGWCPGGYPASHRETTARRYRISDGEWRYDSGHWRAIHGEGGLQFG